MKNSKLYKDFVKELQRLSDSEKNSPESCLKSCLETDIKIFEFTIKTLNSVDKKQPHVCNCQYCGVWESGSPRLEFLDSIVDYSYGSTAFWRTLTVRSSLFKTLIGLEDQKVLYYRGNFIPYLLCDDLYLHGVYLQDRDMSSYRYTIRTFKMFVNLYKYILKHKIYETVEKLNLEGEIKLKIEHYNGIVKQLQTKYSSCAEEISVLQNKLKAFQ
jgi:hypothetical protein